MCVGSVDSYLGRQHRGGPNSRNFQQLLLGPWLHSRFKETSISGDLKYPENAKFAMDAHMMRWFDHYLKGTDNGVTQEPIVRYYVMGAVDEESSPGNEWRTASDWPIKSAPTHYFPHADGTLQLIAPDSKDGVVSWLSDPFHPASIPTIGFPGAKDARVFEQQAEVRTFTTDTLKEPVEWTGKVQAELMVSSDAQDTDFIVRVSDVYPDGRSILIMDYVRRARYREGYEKEVFLKPGEVTKVAFDVGWLSQIFNRGHRIRITVASTGAPFYEPNPNLGEPLTFAIPANAVVARNQLHVNQRFTSRIIAPVVK
jgi:putative CocE/NonD family hydrolase